MVQQKYNIHLEISSLHSKRSAYTLTLIQNNIVQQTELANLLRKIPARKMNFTRHIFDQPSIVNLLHIIANDF